jgi:hypothetical protein
MTFPTLKTGAVAQYPLRRTLTHSTEVAQFVDGSEQRFRRYRTPLRVWVIRLDVLDETEAADIALFFDSNDANTRFAFTDPADGKTYPNCSIGQDEFEISLDAEMRAGLQLIIRENRS